MTNLLLLSIQDKIEAMTTRFNDTPCYNDALLQLLSKQHDISTDDVKYIFEKSEALMPILLIQYKNDIDMICRKVREYQKILIQQVKNKKK